MTREDSTSNRRQAGTLRRAAGTLSATTRYHRTQPYGLLRVVAVAVVLILGCGRASGQVDGDSTKGQQSIASSSDAIAQVYRYAGFSDLRSVPPSAAADMASLETVEYDSTPFLGLRNRGKQVWKVRIEKVSLDLRKWDASTNRNQYAKDYEFWIDPDSGHLLRVTARYNGPPVDLPPEPPADKAEASLRTGGEIYEGYPEHPPSVTLQEAFEEAMLSSPLKAKELVAVYVMWSYRGEPARPVWSITGRGVPMLKSRPGVPHDGGRMRSIVDATSGQLVMASSSPKLDWENWKGSQK